MTTYIINALNKKFEIKIDIDLILTQTIYFMLLPHDSDMINKVKIILNAIPNNTI
jgi:hypothetical protein